MVTWTINGTTVDGIDTDAIERTRGETTTLGLLFHDSSNGTIADRYAELRGYSQYADRVEVGTDANRRPWFYELTPDDDPVRNHVWNIQPSSGVGEENYWGLVVGMDDPSRTVSQLKRLDAEVVYLAEGHRYSTRQEVVNDLGQTEGCYLLADSDESNTDGDGALTVQGGCAIIRGSYAVQG